MSCAMKKILRWLNGIKSDKLLHFIAGLLIAQISYALFFIGFAEWLSILLAFGTAACVGGEKELIDWATGSGVPSLSDFLATLVGGAIGSLVVVLILLI